MSSRGKNLGLNTNSNNNNTNNNNGTEVNKRIILSIITGSSSKQQIVDEIKKFEGQNLRKFHTFDQYTVVTPAITKKDLMNYLTNLKETFINKINYADPVSESMNENKKAKKRERNFNSLEHLLEKRKKIQNGNKQDRAQQKVEARKFLGSKQAYLEEQLQALKERKQQEVKKMKEILKLIEIYNQLVSKFKEIENLETTINIYTNIRGNPVPNKFSRPISNFIPPAEQRKINNVKKQYETLYDNFINQLAILKIRYKVPDLQIKTYLSSKSTNINKIKNKLKINNLSIQTKVENFRKKLANIRNLIVSLNQANTTSAQLTNILKELNDEMENVSSAAK